MSTTYRIETLSDFFKVPAARRADMLREFAMCLEFAELAGGEGASMDAFTWVDDGQIEIKIESPGHVTHGMSLTVTRGVS